MKKSKFFEYNYFLVIFFTFLGYYGSVLAVFSLGLDSLSRIITIPIRILLILIYMSFIVCYGSLKFRSTTIAYLIFSILYVLRIMIDYNLNIPYYLSYLELFLFFTSFSIIPFLSLERLKLNEKVILKIRNGLFVGSTVFSSLSIYTYYKYFGKVTRLTTSTADQSVISPLILSYCSALIIGSIIFYLLFNNSKKWLKLCLIVLIILSIIPFVLGASRGGLVALFIPIIFYIITLKKIKEIFIGILIIMILILSLVYIDSNFQTGILSRFLETSENINRNDSSAERIIIWKNAINQFIENPIFGQQFKINNWNGYAHNVLIESLLTVGVVGTLPFLYLLIKSLIISFNIFKQHKKYAWLVVIFLQSLTQFMFSGAIYTASWFWTSLAILYSLDTYLKNEKK